MTMTIDHGTGLCSGGRAAVHRRQIGTQGGAGWFDKKRWRGALLRWRVASDADLMVVGRWLAGGKEIFTMPADCVHPKAS